MSVTSIPRPTVTTDFGANTWLIEDMREAWLADPTSVLPSWVDYFQAAEAQPNWPGPAEPTRPAPAPPILVPAASPPPAQPAPAAPPARPALSLPPAPAAPPAPSAPPAPAAPPTLPPPPALPALTPAPPRPAPPTLPAPPEPAPQPDRPPRATVEPETKKTAESPQRHEAGLPANPPNPRQRPLTAAPEPERSVLRSAALRTAQNMDASLALPTATSVRTIPMKLVIDLRDQMNKHLRQTRGGKISFTHLVAYAMVEALRAVPALNVYYDDSQGKAALVRPNTCNLGLAIDVERPDGSRQLLVPNIKQADSLDFAQFVAAYEDLVQRAHAGQLRADDFAGTTCTLTNPGGGGTDHSIPRLMPGQGVILGVGSIDYAPGFQGASPSRLSELGISRVMALTSTYDHRVIQGAQSGEFLAHIEQLLIGQHDFYGRVFTALRIPYAPLAWDVDIYATRQHEVSKTARVMQLIAAYRSLGHLMADTDPLLYRLRSHPDLVLATHGLTLWDLDREFAVGTLGGQQRQYLSLRTIMDTLQDAYCRTIGVEYMHISDPEQRLWIQQRLESPRDPISYTEHMRILDRLIEAELFETFLQTKFVGQKRFSLEGGESAIVLLDQVCEQAARAGLEEVCIGMPHRGRLNVLANIVGKSYSQIFQEFEEGIQPSGSQGTGDVKYHLGAEGRFAASNGDTIRASVAANPSHLEMVDPVLEGIARAKQDRSQSTLPHPALPILIHGDAAFAGQGVTFETLQMSQLRGYTTGGTVHVVINNQVGFTTAPVESRSSTYCTDVAKAIQAPVFHVNGDDPDACVRVARLAFDYRQRFNKDVVIDLVCYRRRGHNEGDDPSFTQPLMYDLIKQKRTVRALYSEALIGRGDISPQDAEEARRHFNQRLESVFAEVRDAARKRDTSYVRRPRYPAKPAHNKSTSISWQTMRMVADAHTRFPEGFTVHPKVLPQLERRAQAILNGPIDWATAEMLAIGSLLIEGHPVRLAGQDTRRGTFSQRFGAVVDRLTNEAYVPLKHLSDSQGSFDIYDSLLSEYAALGFEYGYSVAAPEALVMWEAQFGDFANTAQGVIDEFIVSGEAKWQQNSGVVLLLPHGYEGQGPDHSSARLERWLQLCSEGALVVCQPSTPASYFHLLRTHAYVNWHRPMVVATPKSMLRQKQAVSVPEDFSGGQWRHVLPDPSVTDPSQVERILLCSGKLRWELASRRAELGLEGRIAILPLERLYPLPAGHLAAELAKYPHIRDLRYVQEEPANQGAWSFLEKHLPVALKAESPDLDLKLSAVTRPASSAPAVGTHCEHEDQQRAVLTAAFA
ncbi:MAG: multifunctional oxoglutarate decarboxylase/oxoglutarate dehydrogenase thiamine pyrophosphate-binding subunit/dihydrolipoyllysine-residue succinyltransferase subunit [Propionibacteriaceae bacterium]|nr:multifunctional oxoglutarate decarboxylase/oxoglutarate dehydrogenase thiamine pyrophosphate-binding subunit/dihydrolipoyllysine-residue succinyltransferase subunit [Propionibacteriaceae bacterium]